MTWRITREDVELFRRELWKDERSFPLSPRGSEFVKDCFDIVRANREEAVLRLLSGSPGEPLVPQVLWREGSRLAMTWAGGMRLFEVLRALLRCEQRRRDGKADAVRSLLIDRQRSRLRRIQLLLWEERAAIAATPYPLESKLRSLLILLSRVLGVTFGAPEDRSVRRLAEDWTRRYCNMPFRDATPKNTILVHGALERENRPPGDDGDVSAVEGLLRVSDIGFWNSVPLLDVDFASVEHLTSPEDDPISLHCHEWTYGSRPIEPESMLLLSEMVMPDAERTAATLLVRYLRFGGRKLAYRLLNSQGYEIRFRYDDPLFYFRHLPPLLEGISASFCRDYAPLVSLVTRIGLSAGNPLPADRQLLDVDHFRAVYGHAGDYWDENPRGGDVR